MLTRVLAIFLALYAIVISASRVEAQHLLAYRTSGLIDRPTVEVLQGGLLRFSATAIGGTVRGKMIFYMLPSTHGAFHHAAIEGLSSTRSKRFERSFDLHFQLRKEIGRFPAIAVDLHDFNGTGIYASEYLVATKTIGDRLAVTCGIG